jgi:hypothetical protein
MVPLGQFQSEILDITINFQQMAGETMYRRIDRQAARRGGCNIAKLAQFAGGLVKNEFSISAF